MEDERLGWARKANGIVDGVTKKQMEHLFRLWRVKAESAWSSGYLDVFISWARRIAG